ncbi:dTDP-4-dehydrorhamnose reductase [Mycobacteriaceae bacterium 1482268.1]|nr:dTDP-4-dehydrorhamnose reductase [Mycobacteriaceae bacterium 1482268.1]
MITGAGGQLGSFLTAETGRRDLDVLAMTSAQWDITNADAAEQIVSRGDIVVNCAAYTAVDAAESDPQRAYAVNAAGPGILARACMKAGARLIHVSTDYVFDGVFDGAPRPYEVDDATGPLSVYGKTKLAGEQAVHDELPDGHVVRTAWVYTGVGSDFVGVMRRLAAGDGPVTVVADQVGSPTYVADLGLALLEIAQRPSAPQLLHVANEGAASRYEQARAVFEGVGADPERVHPATTEEVPRPAPRPRYTALSSSAAVAAGLTPLRPWRDALAAALAQANGN